MLFLMHCTFTQRGETHGHGVFDFLVSAADVDDAKAKLRAELDRQSAVGDTFEVPVEVYLEDVIELRTAPKHGVIGRFQLFMGDRPPTVSRPMPVGRSSSCVLHEPLGDDEDEAEDDVTVEPFAVYGPKTNRQR
jgi:hypothetical protein